MLQSGRQLRQPRPRPTPIGCTLETTVILLITDSGCDLGVHM